MPIVHPCYLKLASLSAVFPWLAELIAPLAYPCRRPATVVKLRGLDGEVCV